MQIFLLLGNFLSCIFNGFFFFSLLPSFWNSITQMFNPKNQPSSFLLLTDFLLLISLTFWKISPTSVCSLNPPNYFHDLIFILDTSLGNLLTVPGPCQDRKPTAALACGRSQAPSLRALCCGFLQGNWFQYIPVFPPGMFNVPRKMSHLLSER